MKRILPTIVLCLLGACASTSNSMPPAGNSMEQGYLPTPFSATDIGESCTEGAFRTFSMETPEGMFSQTMTFGAGDSDGAVFTVVMTDTEGNEVVNQTMPHTPWTEFQKHASYEAATTTITRESRTTPAGDFECWVYKTSGPLGLSVTNYFAVDLPGPPVYSLGIGPGGEQVLRMELLDYGK